MTGVQTCALPILRTVMIDGKPLDVKIGDNVGDEDEDENENTRSDVL